MVSANARWAFETARQVLRRVDDVLGENLEPPRDAAANLAEAIATLPGAAKVYFVDTAGVARLTTDPEFKPIDVRDREYFAAVKNGQNWHISSLLVSRLNGEQIFTVSKRIERNGVFAGAAIVSLNADFLEGVWRSLNLDEKSTVGLIRGDGQLVSRFPMPGGPLDLSQYVLFTDHLPKAPSGVYRAISPADGIVRIVGYKRVPGTDLIALSSISTEAAFASFWASLKVLLAIVMPTVLGLGLASFWTLRLLLRDAQRRQDEAQFRLMAEAMPNHVWTARADGTLDWFNLRCYDYSGAPEGAFNGEQAWTTIVHPDDVEAAARLWSASLTSGKPYENEFRLLRHDGAYRYHIARAEPIVDANGRITRWIGTNTDIDDQKRVTQQLAASEVRLRLAIQAGQLAVWEIDVASRAITPSAALNRLYGFPDDANPTLADYQSRYAPGELERLNRIGEETSARNEREFEAEIRHLLPDGTEKWLLIRAQTEITQGIARRTLGVAIDVTARKRFEQALEVSERRFRLSQQAAGLGSLELDIATGMVMGSEKFWEIWGLSPRDAVHISVLESIVLPEDKDVRSTPETRKSGTATPNVEYRIRRPDTGEIRWLSRHIEFAHDDSGNPVKMFGIMQDITAQKEAQVRQETLMYELEHRIKNILAMVTAIATQTFKNNDVDAARNDFKARLAALGNAHDILTRTRWKAASMAEVLQASMAPLPAAQLFIDGPVIQLPPNMALSMALAVHELGTNAVKYGALSVPEGRVDVSWQLHPTADGPDPSLVWNWRETGGPLVSKPTRQGFGSQLISRVLAADFRGTVTVDYLPAGLEVTLTAPFSP